MKTTLFPEVSTLGIPHLTAHAIKAQFVGPLSGCYSATATSCYFQPCVPWTANFRWINSAPATNEPLIAEVDAFDEALRYEWYVDGNLIETTYGPNLHSYNWPCTDGNLTVMAFSACGKSELVEGGPYSPVCNNYMMTAEVFPNPAQSMATVKLKEPLISYHNKAQVKGIKSFNKVTILSREGISQRIWNFSKNSTTARIDVSGLRPDVYFIILSDGRSELRTLLVVSR